MLIVPVEKKIDWKRPPIVLILIVVLNLLVFIFYQSGDNDRLIDAVTTYQKEGLLEQEWRAFQSYSKKNDLQYELDQDDPDSAWYIVPDPGFDRFMEKNYRHYIDSKDHSRWRASRDLVEENSSQVSSRELGLNSADVQPLQLISHQFLHGGVMHIIGNMVFLILTGFAVEAALGGLRFLAYYLLSGVGAGLLFSLLDPSAGMLVGASGSISGVMAMYVMLFGFRKIEFFYWLFIFTGYVRVAAIVMLPFYIGYECYQYFSNDGSNVAYTAHIGGFIAGAALVFLTQSLNKSGIDESYIEEGDKPVDPFAQSLNKLYALIAHCDFKRAWTALKPLKAKYPEKSILIEIEYNLVRAVHPQKLNDYLLHRMDKKGNSRSIIQAQLKAWSSYDEEKSASVSINKRVKLLESALTVNALSSAEKLFTNLKTQGLDRMELAMLASRISSFCQANELYDKKLKYAEIANDFAKADVNRSSSNNTDLTSNSQVPQSKIGKQASKDVQTAASAPVNVKSRGVF